MTKKPTDDHIDQTTFPAPMADTTNGAKKPPKPVELRSAHDFALTRQALTTHADDLEGLSKKVKEGGYEKESRTIGADAGTIREVILPQFMQQQELPLVSTEALEKQIGDALHVEIFRTFDGLDDPKARITPQGMRGRRDRLVDLLATRVMLYAREVAEAGWNAGYQQRTLTTEVLAAKPIATLRGGRAD